MDRHKGTSSDSAAPGQRRAASLGRLQAQPVAPPHAGGATGLLPLDLSTGRDGLIYVPASYREDQAAPLIVLLHGAGGRAQKTIQMLQPLAERHCLLLLVPDSRGQTWDVIMDAYGPDVIFLDQALDMVFRRYYVNPGYVGIGGFSDGASYALSLGVSNGDLFSHILAFSPGFLAPRQITGAPRIFISHGVHDTVLPIDLCSRRIVPRLEDAGYEVCYQEFNGPHTVPVDIANQAVMWFLSQEPARAG